MKGISEGRCPLPSPHLPGQSSHYGRLSLGQTCLPLGECMTTTPGDFHGFHVPGEWFPELAALFPSQGLRGEAGWQVIQLGWQICFVY